MRFKSFDIVNIVLSKTNEWLGKDFKIVNDKVKVLEQYCSAIDKIIDRNHGDEISCDVNEETLAVLIEFVIEQLSVDDPKNDMFTQLVARSAMFSISNDDGEHIRVSFVFPSLWEHV